MLPVHVAEGMSAHTGESVLQQSLQSQDPGSSVTQSSLESPDTQKERKIAKLEQMIAHEREQMRVTEQAKTKQAGLAAHLQDDMHTPVLSMSATELKLYQTWLDEASVANYNSTLSFSKYFLFSKWCKFIWLRDARFNIGPQLKHVSRPDFVIKDFEPTRLHA